MSKNRHAVALGKRNKGKTYQRYATDEQYAERTRKSVASRKVNADRAAAKEVRREAARKKRLEGPKPKPAPMPRQTSAPPPGFALLAAPLAGSMAGTNKA